MKTLRYNTETGQYTTHQGQYVTYDKNFGRIDPPVVQLEVVEVERPEIDTETQRVSMTYKFSINEGKHDLYAINGTATEVWTITDKTEEEIQAEKDAAQAALEASSEYKIEQLEGVIVELIEKLNDKEIIP